LVLSYCYIPPPPTSTLVPYTTLFRSLTTVETSARKDWNCSSIGHLRGGSRRERALTPRAYSSPSRVWARRRPALESSGGSASRGCPATLASAPRARRSRASSPRGAPTPLRPALSPNRVRCPQPYP